MAPPSKRRRTATKLPNDFIDADEAIYLNEAARKRPERPTAGRRPSAAAAVAEDSDLESSLGRATHSDHGCQIDDTDSDEDDEGSVSAEEDDRPRRQQAAAATALDAPLSKDSLQQLNKKVNATLGTKTQSNYAQYITVFRRWVAADGYTKVNSKSSTCKPKAAEPDLGQMEKINVVNLLYRFSDWWVVRGREGDTEVGGRTVAPGEYGRSACMKLHSALQDHLNAERRAAGKDTFILNQTAPYDGLYKVYCSKKRDRILVTAIVEGTNPAMVHMSFGRDPYIRGVHLKLASDKPEDACTLSMYTAQVAMVARGDDLRPRTLRHLATRLLSCIGPSTAVALTVLQPQGSGKTLKRPAYKGMLRARLPECCAVGSLFRWMAIRFTVLAEPIPKPGSTKLSKFFLWPGRAGDEMSRNTHGDRMEKLFRQLGVETTKVTHEFRIYAAQLMYEMGVSLEVIQRIGHWLLDSFGTAYIVPGFTAEALLALGLWPGAAQKDFTGYWSERFHVAIPELLIQLLMPGLATLEQEAAAAAADDKPNAEADNLCKVLRMGAVVVVQDALELAEKFPNNPVHVMLLKEPTFQLLLQNYKTFKVLGGFEPQRPLTVKETIKDLLTKHTQTLVQHFNSALCISTGSPTLPCGGAASLNWQGYEEITRESHQDLLQQQQHPLTPQEVMVALQKVAAGQLEPSAELVERLRQQKDVLNDAQDSPQPPDTVASTGAVQDHAAASTAQGGAAAPAAQPIGGLGTPGSVGAATFDSVVAATTAPGWNPPAAVATTTPLSAGGGADAAANSAEATAELLSPSGMAGHISRPGSPDVQVAFMVDEPQELLDTFSTPSGAKYSRQQLTERTAHTLTPGGTHCRAFYMGQEAEQTQQQTGQGTRLSSMHAQAVQRVPSQQQQQEAAPGERQLVQHQPNLLTFQLQQQLQQQQRLLDLLTKQVQLTELRQCTGSLQQTQQQPQACDLDAQHHDPALQQLQTQQSAMQQEICQMQKVLLQRQQAGQQLQCLQQSSNAILGNMGSVDPIASIWQPYINSQPELNVVLGAATNSVAASSAGMSSSQAAMVMALLQQREDRLVQRTVDGIKAELTGTVAAAAHQSAQAVGSSHNDQNLNTHVQPSVAQHASSSKQQGTAKGAGSGKIGFPDLSTHSTLVNLADWYYTHTLGNTGQTPQELESAGSDNDYQWRGGPRHRFQRWNEYVQLLKAIEAARDRLTDEQRQASNHPHRVAQVDAITAARELDAQRKRFGLSLCEFREYCAGSGKGYKKGKAKELEMEAAAGADS